MWSDVPEDDAFGRGGDCRLARTHRPPWELREAALMTCPFCDPARLEIIWSSPLSIAFHDRFPVSPGHTLIVPRRHVTTWFDASSEEQADLLHAVNELKHHLDAKLLPTPDGYNVGFNAGEAAGQTVMHLHVHLIPRYRGDMDDPRGGVRGVIPWRQRYDPEGAGDDDPFAGMPSLVRGQDEEFGHVVREGLRHAQRARLLAAFAQPSGLDEIEEAVLQALERGTRIELLTGDYLHVTSPDALRRLFEWSRECEGFSARLYQTAGTTSFHAKAYLFEAGGVGVGYVGSSNLSRTALRHGVEWNLRTLRPGAGGAFELACARFDALFHSERAAELTRELIDAYARLARVPPGPEPRGPRPIPHMIQQEALEALNRTRAEGAKRGLVVMATGLGKTYLSAFDFERMGGQRVLFVAHREEILRQAMTAWQHIFPDRYVGLMVAGQRNADADVLFASVQSLSRQDTLRGFSPTHFDYIVMDEFHHAAAATYRRVLHHFQPRFLLGLTATPDRMDGAPLRSLCDDNEVYSAGLVRGITAGRLVPFQYFGVADEVDFQPIPWRSGRFDPAELTRAVATESRAAQALRAYRGRAPEGVRRGLAFCCSVAHAEFMAEYLNANGVTAAAVHSAPTSAPRTETLRALMDGELEVICAVDLFNEGLDIPDINVVLMLRPTESPVVFLQQLGRGLRLGQSIHKPYLTVVDFIGNHRSFLQKPQTLLALSGVDMPAFVALQKIAQGELELPPGCEVEIETKAIDMLRQIAQASRDDTLVHEYTLLRDTRGRRPHAGEVFSAGVHMKPVRDRYGTWFDFVHAQGDLTDDERRVLERHRAWFQDLGKTRMNKSFKMVALLALIDRGELFEGASVPELAVECRELLLGDHALRYDAPQEAAEGEGPKAFERTWRRYPLEVLAGGKEDSQRWFELDEETFVPTYVVLEEDRPLFEEMTEELVDLRLREYRSKLAKSGVVSNQGAPIPLRVSHSSGRPILRLDREHYPELPASGDEVTVTVGDERIVVRFQKIAANVGFEHAGGPNVLPRVLRSLFGPQAGLPGTRHFALLRRIGDEWALTRDTAGEEEEGATILPFPKLPYYPDLAVACGSPAVQDGAADAMQSLRVQTDREISGGEHFVVRAQGDSMDGGDDPIKDGDLVLCRWVDATMAEQFEGKRCLLSGYQGPDMSFAQIKIPVRSGGRWVLRSENPEHEDQSIPPDVRLHVAARVIGPVREADGITLWGNYEREEVVRLFGQNYGPSWRVGHRNFDLNGAPHAFLFVTLRKPESTPIEHRYADRFLSPREFQWESQATTTPGSRKGQSIIAHRAQNRRIHLFVRPEEKVPFVYCGTVQYVRHEGEKPMRVWFRLDEELPKGLYARWVG
jgi:superfamily II DNA or RNA helicase/diadenosine tetraphosphate (Ap4A) HIT family hydrolase